MLFNSLQFLAFFPIVVVVYWALPKGRNYFLLAASYYFYMNWQPAYALLLLFSTVTTWGGAMWMSRLHGLKRKTVFISTIVINLGILFSYKYLSFAGDELRKLLDSLDVGISVPSFSVLLPVGISFYTFQAVGYIIDVKRGTIKPERNIFTYALFVSFFPQLVAGPIERAKNLIHQFHIKHKFNADMFIKGLELMLFGYFMKLCIADDVAPYVDAVFNNLPHHNGNSILLASVFFTFQIFGDFAGYSMIAIGCAKCMGFTLMTNFRQPYLATSVKDFWRRWHISLSTWFSDYVYIPLGGNRVKPYRHYMNLFITFLLSGIWHGANYTYVAWGAYHGSLQCVNAAYRRIRHKNDKRKTVVSVIIGIAVTFVLSVIGWVIFRANSMSDAILALTKIFKERGMLYNGDGMPAIIMSLLLIGLLMTIEIIKEYRQRHGVDNSDSKRSLVRSALCSALLLVVILLTAKFNGGQFIYFQF